MSAGGWINPVGEDAKAPGQRRAGRDSLFLGATLRIADEPDGTDVRVRNLSEGGLMAEIEQPLAIGTPVTVELRGVGRVRGTVAWYAEGRAGIALDQAIDPSKARKPVGGRRAEVPGTPSSARR